MGRPSKVVPFKRCPFCGSDVETESLSGVVYVGCANSSCVARPNVEAKSFAAAKKLWNTRAGDES